MTKRVIAVENLPRIDDLEVQVLRILVLHMDEDGGVNVPYEKIGKAIDQPRENIRKAVNRMRARRVLVLRDGKLYLPCSTLANI